MSTPVDAVIKSAAAVARDAAEGRLDPAALDAVVTEECRELFGTVAGPADPLWPVQVDVARQVLALGGVPADELSEWVAVGRRRAGEPSPVPDPSENTSEVGTSASGPYSPDNASPGADSESPAGDSRDAL
ncbi:flagellar hook-length control protein [Mycobacterium sp. C31M]